MKIPRISRPRGEFFVSVVSMGDVARKPVSLSVKSIKAVALAVACIVVGLMVFLVIAFVRIGEMSRRIEDDRALIEDYNGALQEAKTENLSLMERLEQALNDLAEVSAFRESDAEPPEVVADESSLTIDQNKDPNVIQMASIGLQIPSNANVELLDWFGAGHKFFSKGKKATVIDVETGLSFEVKRFGGDYHADSFPLTKEDAAMMKRIYGGEWSWDRRAIWLLIDNRVVAASMNGMPHMVDANPSDGFPGHFCIHLYKSKVHENEKECPQHQKMVKKAFEEGKKVHNKQL